MLATPDTSMADYIEAEQAAERLRGLAKDVAAIDRDDLLDAPHVGRVATRLLAGLLRLLRSLLLGLGLFGGCVSHREDSLSWYEVLRLSYTTAGVGATCARLSRACR